MAATDPRASFLSAVDTFESLVGAIPVGDLNGPGLGEWDLRALVGHASRSLVTVESYLEQPADVVEVPTAADYYVAVAGALLDQAAVTERGRVAGAALGAEPAEFIRALAQRVREKLSGRDPAYVLTTIAGPMELDEYLRTRTFELVVHGLDIAAATRLPVAYDVSALAEAATLAAEIAVLTGGAPDLLLAATGRRTLPGGFSVV
ncbi:MAG: maleylpyruvate isomerase N-terminal domain-containing protein [Nocardioides sp.]